MAWERILEDWKRLKENIKGKRGKLPGADLTTIDLRRHQPEKIQERYRHDNKQQVSFDWDAWLH